MSLLNNDTKMLAEILRTQRETNRLLRESGEGNNEISILPEPKIIAGLARGLVYRGYRYKSKMFIIPNIEIIGNKTIYDERHGGAIQEVIFLSDSTVDANMDYSVKIMADGENIYNDSYTGFAVLSPYETDMSAFEDVTYDRYVTTFQNIFFNDHCYIQVYDSTAKFLYIILKIVKRLEK